MMRGEEAMIKKLDLGVGFPKHAASIRKVQANRQNALKSTGPKTPKGKRYSRRNAFKHGLFAMTVFMWDDSRRESQQQYQELLDRLAENYQPVGAAEDLEVERIAVCWWRLRCAWGYENSEISLGHANVAVRVQEAISRGPLLSRDRARLALLRSAEMEIEDTGKISDQLKEKMFDADGEFRTLWELLERPAKKMCDDIYARQAGLPLSAGEGLAQADPDSSTHLILATTVLAICALEHKAESMVQSGSKVAYDGVAVPKSETLDRVLRADAAAERNLNRAIDRLERLQRRRQGEAVPPAVSVRLTR
jgi:hypothetical protein